MTFDYGITDTELIVEGTPPSQSVYLEATFEVFSVQLGEDVVTTTYGAQAGAAPTEGDVGITEPFQRLKFAESIGNYPGAETVTLLDDSFVGFFDSSRIPSGEYFSYQMVEDYMNGDILLADLLAFAYAGAQTPGPAFENPRQSVANLPGEVNVPINVYFSLDNFDSNIAEVGTIPIQREGGTFDPSEVYESGCSLSSQSITGSGTTTATYEIQNANENDAASVTVEVLVDGQRAGTDQATIQPSSTTTFAFDIPLSAPGDYNISYDIVNVEKA
jgi:hypothetical protein